jgi:formylglycine-generating enzyme required for sulfatase activity
MMNRTTMKVSFALGLTIATATAAAARFPASPVRRCAPDAVPAGTVCLDKYEATVWRVPGATTTNAFLVTRIQLGRATEADLREGGAVQLGVKTDDYARCTDAGQSCSEVYAVSLPSTIPSTRITWFQAQEACANSRKRLPTNAEWQVGANGTPDPGPDNGTTDCNTASDDGASPTGVRTGCVSARGAFDMVGNIAEWVADWVPLSTACPGWGAFSNDLMCVSGASETGNAPGALVRGGFFFLGSGAGPLTVFGTVDPTRSEDFFGFRCAR